MKPTTAMRIATAYLASLRLSDLDIYEDAAEMYDETIKFAAQDALRYNLGYWPLEPIKRRDREILQRQMQDYQDTVFDQEQPSLNALRIGDGQYLFAVDYMAGRPRVAANVRAFIESAVRQERFEDLRSRGSASSRCRGIGSNYRITGEAIRALAVGAPHAVLGAR